MVNYCNSNIAFFTVSSQKYPFRSCGRVGKIDYRCI